MKPIEASRTTAHSTTGRGLVLFGFLAPGLLVLAFAVWADLWPDSAARVLKYEIASPWVRLLTYLVGGGLALIGVGLLRFRRWAWYAALAWAAWSTVEIAIGLLPDPRFATIPFLQLAAPPCGIYVWRRRSGFFRSRASDPPHAESEPAAGEARDAADFRAGAAASGADVGRGRAAPGPVDPPG